MVEGLERPAGAVVLSGLSALAATFDWLLGHMIGCDVVVLVQEAWMWRRILVLT